MSVVRKILQTKRLLRTRQNRLILVLNCAVCDKKKRFIKNQEPSRLELH